MYATEPFETAAQLALPEQEAFLRNWLPDETILEAQQTRVFQDMLNFCFMMHAKTGSEFAQELAVSAFTFIGWVNGQNIPNNLCDRQRIISLAIDIALNRRN